MQIHKLFRTLTTISAGVIVVASSACSADGIAPTSSERTPAPAARPLLGLPDIGVIARPSSPVADGVYTFEVDPRRDQVLTLGRNRLVLPAGSVCALGASGYGPTMWDKGCEPHERPFTLTVTVAGTGTENAALDFQPAMRFNPSKRVTLDFHVPNLSATTWFLWTIFYCPTPDGQPEAWLGTSLLRSNLSCIDESLTDPSLLPAPDFQNSLLSRRLKHFSTYQLYRGGYTVAE